MRALLLAVMMISVPAHAADQFDLICTGREKASALAPWRPHQVRYRIDLLRMVYCRYECTSMESIAKADDAEITFERTSEDAEVYVQHYVNRTDGHWKYFVGGAGEEEGVCEVAPFSGMPKAKF